ncbi:hypothetical protein G2W53_014117 [Senna tora]|uniref:DUF4283 domain-containing protein n=1 Tax=Senna tora TaxID=362788 RepID=A0A834WSX3_9FABA|nr:hypothetical protein G2W53_014117 [Senna tora]
MDRMERARNGKSTEESDQMDRSSKNVKVGDLNRPPTNEKDVVMGEQGFVSFRDKLLGMPNGGVLDEEANEAWAAISDDGEDERLSSGSEDSELLTFSQEEYESWCQPWRLTLLVRLMGRNMGVSFMCNRLEKLWGRNGGVQVTDLDNGYFACSFNDQEDYLYAFQGGPWMIADHYLIVQRWRPNFDPFNENEVTRIAVWVRIPNLPLEFYNVEIKGKKYNVEYEAEQAAMQEQCDKGTVGGTSEMPSIGGQASPEQEAVAVAAVAVNDEDADNGNSRVFGPWMKAKRTNKRNVGIQKRGDSGENQGNGKGVAGGQQVAKANQSQFSILRDADKILEENINDRDVVKVAAGSHQNMLAIVPREAVKEQIERPNVIVKGKNTIGPHNVHGSTREIMSASGIQIGGVTDLNVQVKSFTNITGPSKILNKGRKEPPDPAPPNDFMDLEPRQSGVQASNIIRKLGFQDHAVVEASGYAGGIWCLWDSSKLQVELNVRRELWENLKLMNLQITDPWLIGGDFNAFMYNHEKHGGSLNGSKPDPGFKDLFDEAFLVDLGFSGNEYTWWRDSVAIRLDRMICNEAWRHLFNEAGVVHLPNYKLDHNPLWLRLNPSKDMETKCDRPFRFLAPWVLHNDFSNVVQHAWSDGVSSSNALDTLIDAGLGGNQKDALWARVLRAKYRCGDDVLPQMKVSSNSSRLWRAVARNWKHVEDGLEWRLGDGKRTRFWLDVWVPNCGKLADLALGPLSQHYLHSVVGEYSTSWGGWDWSRFEFRVPMHVRNKIAAIWPPSNLSPSDQLAWKHTKDGSFSVKTAYQMMDGSLNSNTDILWRKVWRLQVP